MRISLRMFSLVLVLLLFVTACSGNTVPVESKDDETADKQTDVSVSEVMQFETVGIAPDGDPKWWTYSYGGIETQIPDVELTGLTELPLVDAPVTITGFRSYSNAAYVAEPEDIKCNQWLEEVTGVVMDWTHVNTAEQYQIFFTSGDYTDIVVESGGTSAYTGGLDKAMEDGVYVSGNAYLQQMPHFMAYLNHSDEIRRECVTDNGTYFFPTIKYGYEPPWTGPMVRGDWLKDLGLDIPTTYADWYDMLTLFKTEKGASAALGLSSQNGYDQMGHGLDAGYGVIGAFYAENGTDVKYGFVEEGFRDYIAMLAQWYHEGLIDRDFMSHVMWSDGQGMVLSGATGAYDSSVYSFSYIYPMASEESDMSWIAVPIAKKSDDAEKPHFRNQSTLVNASARAVITTAAVERGVDTLCAQWIDFHYSDSCSYAMNYGIENESWVMGEDGVPHLTDAVLNNPDYATSGEAGHIYCDNTGAGAGVYMWIVQFDQYPVETFEGYSVWGNSADCDWMMPAGLTLTTEEGELYAERYGDIESTMQEYILKFIVGELDINTEWDGYVSLMYDMKLQDCIDIYQTALERYNQR